MKKIFLGFVILSIFAACAKNQDSVIPYVPVRFNSSINNPALLKIKTTGGAVVLPGYGYAGLILYNRGDEIVAYDRCSTVNPEKKCAVNLDTPSLTVTDPCSGAKFLLFDGAAAKAPAVRPLLRYQVSLAGNNISVTN